MSGSISLGFDPSGYGGRVLAKAAEMLDSASDAAATVSLVDGTSVFDVRTVDLEPTGWIANLHIGRRKDAHDPAQWENVRVVPYWMVTHVHVDRTR